MKRTKKIKIKWGNIGLLALLLLCASVVIHDLFMLTIYSWISGNMYGWTWFGFLTFILAFAVGGEINEYYNRSTLYFIKNDIVYAAKNFHIHIYGNEDKPSYVNELIDSVTVDTSNDTDVVVEGEKLLSTSDNYSKVVTRASDKGYNKVLNAYEFKLITGEIKNGINLVFNVGKEYNGKQAIVVHLKKDGTYQEVEKTIADGKIDINVTELSPFIVAIKDNERVLDDVPKTGDNNLMMILSILTIMTLSALGLVIKVRE